jgi:Ca2+-binding RTX toxin-like protein
VPAGGGSGLLPIQLPGNIPITVYNDQPTDLNLLANAVDPNPGGTLDYSTVNIVTPPANAQVNVNPNTGLFRFTPSYLLPPGLPPGQQPPDLLGNTLQFTVGDNLGAKSNVATATVTVVVSPAETGFVIPSNANVVTHSLQPVTINVLTNVVINDGSQVDPTSVAVVPTAPPQYGTASVNPVTGLITYTPGFGYIGFDTFDFSVKDTKGNQGTATVSVLINPTGAPRLQPDPLGGQMLVVDGTPNGDNIYVGPGSHKGDLLVSVNGTTTGPFHPTSRVVVFGYGGDNRIQVSDRVQTPAWLVGGRGNDTLLAGGGPSVLMGGPGNDILVAGTGRDVLIGGTGSDVLIGFGNDVLVAGATRFDSNQLSLNAILQEWNAPRSFTERVENLTGQVNNSFKNRLNDNVFLTLPTIQDFGLSDVVYSGGRHNLLYLSLGGPNGDWLIGPMEHSRDVLFAHLGQTVMTDA